MMVLWGLSDGKIEHALNIMLWEPSPPKLTSYHINPKLFVRSFVRP